MPSQLSALSSQLRAKHGFALLIVITLLAFIVIVLVGLSAYTGVETSVAGNTLRQAQARQNALLALNIAVGQLQKNAGPDQRVTATAEAFPNGAGTTHYTGVWDATGTDATPITWLVSGNELTDADGNPQPLAITPETSVTTTNGVALVSANTTRTTNDVLARLQDIKASGVPGVAANTTATVGRYAWWIGDQGVKAPVAVPDTSSSVTYAPYDSVDLRARLRQQIGLDAGASDASGNPVFEPRDTSNTPLVANQKITAHNQIAFLKNGANAQLGLTRVQQNYYAWSPNNYAVLANTKLGGLRQDLSIKPDLLGATFATWANYSSYMEDPTVAVVDPTPAISPAYGSDPLRRRYVMQPPTSAGGVIHSVAPVLALGGLSFNIRTANSKDGSLEVRARWYVSLWNPYSAALVPENLRLEIENLPDPVVVTITTTFGSVPKVVTRALSLYALFADTAHPDYKFPIRLNWDATAFPTQPDNQSWLPGRVYSWISTEHSLTPTPSGGMAGQFYATDFSKIAGQGDTRDTGSDIFSDEAQASVSFAGPVSLIAKLYRESDGALLGTFNIPDFQGVAATAPQALGAPNYQFGFIFRLFESGHIDEGDRGAWLTGTSAVDVRSAIVPATGFRLDPVKADDPAQYQTALDFNDSKYLLDRTQGSTGSQSYNEDTPLFELPRAPLLSLGVLQHLALDSARPFSIGNSWGADVAVKDFKANELFDRFFFSGLVSGIAPDKTAAGDIIFPNPLIKPLRKADGTKPTIDDIHATVTIPATDTTDAAPSPAAARSSKFFLQSGAFNLNSSNVAAWAAVLRSVRFPAPSSFTYLDASADTGTADDAPPATLPSSTDAQFLRFSQSAQETYKAEAGNSGGAAATELFRRGMRTLAADQVSALAGAIANAVKARQAASGPFRSLEEFLNPAAAGGVSLLEQAIADANINSSITEFSSQWLTQADIMTALAPVLFPRSDTFVVRAYGEAVNPATSATEGKAWCEAIVQRVPDYFDPTDPAETVPGDFDLPTDPTDPASTPSAAHQLNKKLGRRFKVLSFRWLTRSDI